MKALLLFLLCSVSSFGIDTKEFIYEVEGQKYQGYIASPEGDKKVPGVIVVHEWWGHNDYPRMRADELAKEGYVAFAIDLFGKGKVATHPKKAKEFASSAMGDMDGLEKKFKEALSILKKRDDVDQDKVAAIGFCFGGTVVLQMAKRGVDLDLLASFHGGLPEKYDIPKRKDNPKVLIFNGAADPMVTKDQLSGIEKSLKSADVDYTIKNYEGAKHAFTNPGASEIGKKYEMPLEYNKKAAKDSWSKLLKSLDKL
ncbi:MAG: dienelactone hydrolase [Halobacteriovoraceae bacterium]|nr:dienelactone hydrolase [Halobacteriovoraceae bacterium]|tara:strand:+ start:88961 stop:89725 length:765 start_codon:yes stop_codon:yes gene_type:complete